jgi:hypothetical protein
MISPGHQLPGLAGLGMGIADKWPDFIGHYFLNGPVQPATGYPIGIKHSSHAIWGRVQLPVADGLPAEIFKIRFEVHEIAVGSGTATVIGFLFYFIFKIMKDYIGDNIVFAADKVNAVF